MRLSLNVTRSAERERGREREEGVSRRSPRSHGSARLAAAGKGSARGASRGGGGELTRVLAHFVVHHVLLDLLDDDDVLVEDLGDGAIELVRLLPQGARLLLPLPRHRVRLGPLVLPLLARVVPLLLLLLLPLAQPLHPERDVPHGLVGKEGGHLYVPSERRVLVRRKLLESHLELVLLLLGPLGRLHVVVVVVRLGRSHHTLARAPLRSP